MKKSLLLFCLLLAFSCSAQINNKYQNLPFISLRFTGLETSSMVGVDTLELKHSYLKIIDSLSLNQRDDKVIPEDYLLVNTSVILNDDANFPSIFDYKMHIEISDNNNKEVFFRQDTYFKGLSTMITNNQYVAIENILFSSIGKMMQLFNPIVTKNTRMCETIIVDNSQVKISQINMIFEKLLKYKFPDCDNMLDHRKLDKDWIVLKVNATEEKKYHLVNIDISSSTAINLKRVNGSDLVNNIRIPKTRNGDLNKSYLWGKLILFWHDLIMINF